MTISFSAQFKKHKKRILTNPKLDTQFEKRFKQWQQNPKHQQLGDHALKGSKLGLR